MISCRNNNSINYCEQSCVSDTRRKTENIYRLLKKIFFFCFVWRNAWFVGLVPYLLEVKKECFIVHRHTLLNEQVKKLKI